MRILHFISSPAAGGAETYVRDLSLAMQGKGHQIHIVFLQSACESGRDLIFEKNFLRSLSDNLISYSFIGKEARKRPWLGVFRLHRIVGAFQPDVVHCHLYYALLFALFTIKAPIVYTHHSIQLGLPKFIYRLFDRKVKAYIAICHASKVLLESSNRSVVHINNAVSKGRIQRKKPLSLRDGSEITCVFVGSLKPEKNLSLMLRAFGAVKNVNVRLLIVGEGPDRLQLQDLASSLSIDHRVVFLGNISDVRNVLAESDVFLMSSVSEGLPIALIEAAQTGLPVVVTNVGGCAEVVHRCANGFVVDELNVDDYSEALGRMLADEGLRLMFSRNALAFSGEFEIEKSANRHLFVYEDVI